MIWWYGAIVRIEDECVEMSPFAIFSSIIGFLDVLMWAHEALVHSVLMY